MMKRLSLHLLAAILLLSGLCNAQQNELKVLFVGNSYTYQNNLAHIVAFLSGGTPVKLDTRKSVTGGAYLWEHWNGDRNLRTKEIIEAGHFDVVVLQDNSMSAINTPDSILKYVKLFTEYNRAHGAQTYLFQTWARKNVPQYQDEIDRVYTLAAKENGAVSVPVGPAWQLAQQIRPSVELFDTDGSHPSSLGTLLTASLFVKMLSGELPAVMPRSYIIEDANGEIVRIMEADPLDNEFCKRIAEEVLAE
jgi:hypothetical protein